MACKNLGSRASDPRSRAAADGCFLDGPALGPATTAGFDLWAHGRSFGNARTTVR